MEQEIERVTTVEVRPLSLLLSLVNCLTPSLSLSATQDDIVYAGVTPTAFTASCVGKTVEAVCRKGKQLWVRLSSKPHPAFHLGMTGGFVIEGHTPAKMQRYCH